jgi:hypothetical protein
MVICNKIYVLFSFCGIYQLNQTSFTLIDILSTSLINIPDLAGRINYEKGGKYIVTVKNTYFLTFWKYIVTVTLKGYFFNSRLFIKWLTFIILKIGGSNRLGNRYIDTFTKK